MKGEGVRPESVSVKDLAEFMELWEGAIKSTAKANGVMLPMTEGEPVISLVSVDVGSNKLTMYAARTFLPVVWMISSAIASNDILTLPREAREKLHKVCLLAQKREWEIELSKDGELFPTSLITKMNAIPKPGEEVVHGFTTLIGKCERIGGALPRAEIRGADGVLVYIDISKEMAELLAPRIYKEVSIDGEASWDAETWKIVKFRALKLNNYEPTDAAEAFEALTEAVRGDWDSVNVPEYMAEIRGSDDR